MRWGLEDVLAEVRSRLAGAWHSRLRQGFRLCQISARQDGAAGRRKAKLAGQRPALPVVGARRDEDLAQLKPIKVNQGGNFFMPLQCAIAGRRRKILSVLVLRMVKRHKCRAPAAGITVGRLTQPD